MSQKKKALIIVIIGNTIFGFSFMFSKVLLNAGISVLTLLAVRFSIAFISLSILTILRIGRLNLGEAKKRKSIWLLFALGFCQPVLYFVCENYGIALTNSVISGAFIAMIPIVSSIIAVIFLKEKFHKKQLMAIVCSFAGIMFITIAGQSAGEASAVGVILLIGAVIAAAIYVVLGRHISSIFTSFERTYAMFLMGSVVYDVAALIQGTEQFKSEAIQIVTTPTLLGCILFLGVMSSVVSYFCINYATTFLPVAQSSSFTNLTGVISMIAGSVFLGEAFGVVHIVGCVLVISGVFIMNNENTSENPAYSAT